MSHPRCVCEITILLKALVVFLSTLVLSVLYFFIHFARFVAVSCSCYLWFENASLGEARQKNDKGIRSTCP